MPLSLQTFQKWGRAEDFGLLLSALTSFCLCVCVVIFEDCWCWFRVWSCRDLPAELHAHARVLKMLLVRAGQPIPHHRRALQQITRLFFEPAGPIDVLEAGGVFGGGLQSASPCGQMQQSGGPTISIGPAISIKNRLHHESASKQTRQTDRKSVV